MKLVTKLLVLVTSMPTWRKVNKLLTYGVLLDSLIVTYVKYVIILIDLKDVLSQDLKCFCSKSTTVLSEWSLPKTMDMSLLQFYCIRHK